MSGKFRILHLGLLLLAGCTNPVRQQVDALICDRSASSFDLPSEREKQQEQLGKLESKYKQEERRNPANDNNIQQTGIFLTTAQDVKKGKPSMLDRLEVPIDVIGWRPPDVFLDRKLAPPEAIKSVVEKYFPPVPKVERDPDFPPGPDGKPLTLSDLQKIALTNSPLLRQAASDIEAARGSATQAGLYPNPVFGYQSSSAGPGGGPLYGIFMEQTIKTGSKLKLAQAAALMDLKNAELAYRKAETDLTYTVRASYYAVLVAQENIRANRGLVELTDEVYRVMVDQLKGGGAVATYEPLQLSVFSSQAKSALVQARNARVLAWKQLASAMGVPHMPATALAGSVIRSVPRMDFDKALAHILTRHTDILSTNQTIEKARYNLRLAEVAPYPDVAVQAGISNDLSPPGPSRVVSSVQVSVPVPIFDRNQGNIRLAQATLLRANEEPHRVQADLAARFSEAYRRYEENRVLMGMYHRDILPKQVQAFRAAVLRHFNAGAAEVAYSDLVSSEQNLIAVIPAYIAVLTSQWQAVVDVANFLQTDQLYNIVDEVNEEPTLDLENLLKLPCHHPCSDVHQHGPIQDDLKLTTPRNSYVPLAVTPSMTVTPRPLPVLYRSEPTCR